MMMIFSSIFNFLVVVGILWYYGRKPTLEFFANRRNTIESAIRGAENQYAQAESALKVWEQKWSNSQTEANQLRSDAKERAEIFRKRTLESANLEAERIEKDAQLLGKGEVLRAKRTLQREVAERSIRMAEKFLEGHLDERDRHKLVADYMEIVGHGQA